MSIFSSIRSSVNKFFLGHSTIGSVLDWVTPGSWSRTKLLKQYVRKVYAVISIIAENEAKISLSAYKEGASGKENQVVKNEFIDLLRKPNPDYSQFQFLEFHFTYMKLMGESFWYLAKGERSHKPVEMYLLRPDLMDVAIDTEGNNAGLVTGYVLNKPDGTKIPFDKDEIVHFKLPNPENPYRGLGTVAAGKVYIETEEYASKWTRNALLNSGRPSGILYLKGTVDNEQFKKLKRNWEKEQSGIDNVGKTLFLKGTQEVDFKKLGMELQEVALKEMKDMSTDDILFMFRMNKAMMGITDNVNKATSNDAFVFMAENIIKPDWDRFIDQINQFVLNLWKKDEYIKYKKPTLKSDAEKLEEDKALIDKAKTRNEIRQERGLEPVPGGDFLYVAINQVPIGVAPNGSKMLKKKV